MQYRSDMVGQIIEHSLDDASLDYLLDLSRQYLYEYYSKLSDIEIENTYNEYFQENEI